MYIPECNEQEYFNDVNTKGVKLTQFDILKSKLLDRCHKPNSENEWQVLISKINTGRKFTEEHNQITESMMYDDMIKKLQEAKESGTPIDEGLFGAIIGGIAGVTIAPSIMKAVCKILGIDVKGQFGSLITSKLVLAALCTEMGWRK